MKHLDLVVDGGDRPWQAQAKEHVNAVAASHIANSLRQGIHTFHASCGDLSCSSRIEVSCVKEAAASHFTSLWSNKQNVGRVSWPCHH